MADLGAIGLRPRPKQYYGTDNRYPTINTLHRARNQFMLVNGFFSTRSVGKSTRYRDCFIPFYAGPYTPSMETCKGIIAGTTQQNGIPAPFKPVHLFHRPNLIRVRSTISDANGYFSFPYVMKNSTYFVVTLDTTSGQPAFDGAMTDYVTPALMP